MVALFYISFLSIATPTNIDAASLRSFVSRDSPATTSASMHTPTATKPVISVWPLFFLSTRRALGCGATAKNLPTAPMKSCREVHAVYTTGALAWAVNAMHGAGHVTLSVGTNGSPDRTRNDVKTTSSSCNSRRRIANAAAKHVSTLPSHATVRFCVSNPTTSIVQLTHPLSAFVRTVPMVDSVNPARSTSIRSSDANTDAFSVNSLLLVTSAHTASSVALHGVTTYSRGPQAVQGLASSSTQ